MSCVMCHVLRVTCHVSRVTCHASHVPCHMSRVTCHMLHFFLGQSGEGYRWRVCYQRGLHCLVFAKIPLNYLKLFLPQLYIYFCLDLKTTTPTILQLNPFISLSSFLNSQPTPSQEILFFYLEFFLNITANPQTKIRDLPIPYLEFFLDLTTTTQPNYDTPF